MRVPILLTVLVASVVIATEVDTMDKKDTKIAINIVEQEGITSSMLVDIMNSIEEAFQYGSECQAEILVAYLGTHTSTKATKWLVTNGACIAHTSKIYGYFEVTVPSDIGNPIVVNIVGY